MSTKGTCIVCSDQRRQKIDQELRSVLSFGAIAERFSLSKTSIWRHARRCLRDEMASAEAARDAGFSDIVAALDRQSGYLRRVLAGKERLKLVRWNEWSRATVLLERLIGLKVKASRRSSPAPEAKTPEETPQQIAERFFGELKQSERLRERLRVQLYNAGLKTVYPRLEHFTPAELRQQLAGDRSLRMRVMDALADAESWCSEGYQEWVRSGYLPEAVPWWQPKPDASVVPNGDVREVQDT